VSAVFLVVHHAWPAYAGLAVLLLVGRARARDEQPIRWVTLGVLASTLVTHAVFFGAGRYGLLVYPWIAALAAVLLVRWQEGRVLGKGEGAMNFCGLPRHEG
jgi:hypothetical protein